MSDIQITRCAPPHLTARRISTYTILGFTGYVVANVFGAVLASHWGMSRGERFIAFFAPGLAFIAVVSLARALVGHERIVFYQTTIAGVASVIVLGLLTGARVARLLDLVSLGIGTFLVFGQLGCHAVACCHGTLGRGITYGPRHVAIGFWPRWSGRALWPVQLVESIASGVLVIAGLVWSAEPGRAALIYALGYALVRFALELVRGDGARPYKLGLSEAQWSALVTAIACVAWRPGFVTAGLAGTLSSAAIVLILRRHRRELLFPSHLFELDRALRAAGDGARHETSLGVAVSRFVLPDVRTDWILSSDHRHWSAPMARRLAHHLWESFELVAGRTPGVFHAIVNGSLVSAALSPPR